MRKYESVIIIEPEKSEEQVTAVAEAVKAIVEKEGGTVDHVEQWGKKRLAYTVKKHKYGHYTLFHITMKPESVLKLETSFKHNESIIKYMTINHDPRSLLKPPAADSSTFYVNDMGR